MSDNQASEGSNYRRIVQLEDKFDAQLSNLAPHRALEAGVIDAARRWSHAVWSVSQALGARPPSPSSLNRGLAVAQRPVFICGVQRSGTTLMRDLLDGHPRLVVVPTESGFYTGLEQSLFGLGRDEHANRLGCQWLERLVLPPPHWLLGRSRADTSPYVNFARNFSAWWQVGEDRREGKIDSWPLCALALAYAQQLGLNQIPSTAQMWVEKSPTSERFLHRIWHDFPAAKVVHVVRRPEAALASYAALYRHVWGPRMAALHCMRNLAPSYRIGSSCVSNLPSDRYLLLRYEDLVANPNDVMSRVAGFLGIEPLPVLMKPTVAGQPANNNSSFGFKLPISPLRSFERALLALTVARSAGKLGYVGRTTPAYERAIVGESGPSIR